MTDTWQNTWDRTGQPRPWESEIVWRRWESNGRERGLLRPCTETFVDPSPGEIAMPENTNNTQAAGQQQRAGWGDAVEPLESYVIEQYAWHGGVSNTAHVRSMARELLEVRKAQEMAAKATLAGRHQGEQFLGWIERRKIALAETGRQQGVMGLERLASVGHSNPNIPEGVAIVQLANMLAELREWREGKRRPPEATESVILGGHTLWGKAAGVDQVNATAAELAEWRTGRRVSDTQRGVRAMYEVLVNQGWTPPQS